MRLFNVASDESNAVLAETCTVLLKLLTPIAPHICQQLWQNMGGEGEIIDAGWLTVDESALEKDEIHYVVQVNGKLRDALDVPASASKEEIEALAVELEGVKKHSEGKTIRKVIVVPNRLVNIVVG